MLSRQGKPEINPNAVLTQMNQMLSNLSPDARTDLDKLLRRGRESLTQIKEAQEIRRWEAAGMVRK